MVPGHAAERLSIDSTGTQPLFHTNARVRYWIAQGRLLRDGSWGPVYIGDVLEGQTHFWVGPRFGFGLYHAGELSVAFVVDAERHGINDTIRLPPLCGHWVDVRCVFTDTHYWLLVATQVQGNIVHQTGDRRRWLMALCPDR
jgi:hypothetical protein